MTSTDLQLQFIQPYLRVLGLSTGARVLGLSIKTSVLCLGTGAGVLGLGIRTPVLGMSSVAGVLRLGIRTPVLGLGTGAGYSDLITFIRKDYNAKIVNNDTQEDISYLITEVSAEGDRIVIVNICARDGKLKGEHFNYTQKIPHIRNGLQLKKFQQGKTSIDTSQLPASIYNINDQSECTHTTNDRKWAQIDYIISHTNITHKLMNMSYEYELISDLTKAYQ